MPCLDRCSNSGYLFRLLFILLVGLPRILEATECLKSMTIYANSTRQYLTSPNYPNPFPRPVPCSWTITATPGRIVAIQILDFDLESSVFCYKDLFDIIDGPTGWNLELFSACGSYSKSTTHKTIHSQAIVSFRSVKPGLAHRGFNVSYWSEQSVVPEYGKANYDAAHAILLVLSILMGVAFFGALSFLVAARWYSLKRTFTKEEEEE